MSKGAPPATNDHRAASLGDVRRRIGLFGALILASILLVGCAGPATFTIEGTWQFATSASGAVWAAPCDYPHGAITVSDDTGKVLGKGHVTTTDYGLVSGYAVCNVQFKINGVPQSAHTFLFAVPGYEDPTPYTRDGVDLIEIDSP
jgi:hypothetical protein